MARLTPYIAAWCALLVVYAVMTWLAWEHDTFPGDVWLTRRLQDIDTAWVAEPLSWANSAVEWPYWALPAVAGAVCALWAAGPRIAPVIVLGALARFLNNPLKEVAARPRPSPDEVDVERLLSTLSFPSGHAYNAVILYGLIFFLAAIFVRPAWIRLAVQALCVLIILGAGADRVYLGFHWPSDVLGGYICGALVVAPLAALGLWLTGRLRLSPEPAP